MMPESASSPENRRLRSIHWITGSTIVLVLVSILGGLALMLFAARQLDRMESVDEHELVERTIQSDLKRMTRELTSATVWDDAYRAMGAIARHGVGRRQFRRILSSLFQP
jgi:sensor domain CHASE-containing protein